MTLERAIQAERERSPRINLTEVDGVDGRGYSVARHILDEVATAGARGASSALLGYLVGNVTGQQMGAWLRELKTRGWVTSDPDPVMTGDQARWFITDEGRAELARLEEE